MCVFIEFTFKCVCVCVIVLEKDRQQTHGTVTKGNSDREASAMWK